MSCTWHRTGPCRCCCSMAAWPWVGGRIQNFGESKAGGGEGMPWGDAVLCAGMRPSHGSLEMPFPAAPCPLHACFAFAGFSCFSILSLFFVSWGYLAKTSNYWHVIPSAMCSSSACWCTVAGSMIMGHISDDCHQKYMILLNGCTLVKLLKAKGKVSFFFILRKKPTTLCKGCAFPKILISD